MAAQKWAGTTYGNNWMHKWLIRMLRYMDIRVLYVFTAVFVIPVCLLLNPSRGIAYRYFRQRMGYGRLKSTWKTYVNHCLFAQVVIDKFAMYAGRKFDIEIENYDMFLDLARSPRASDKWWPMSGAAQQQSRRMVLSKSLLNTKSINPMPTNCSIMV